MGASNYSDEFKRDVVHQIPVRGYLVREIFSAIGIQCAFPLQMDEGHV